VQATYPSGLYVKTAELFGSVTLVKTDVGLNFSMMVSAEQQLAITKTVRIAIMFFLFM